MATCLLPFDELNLLKEELQTRIDGNTLTEDAAEDIIEELLEISYTYGTIQAATDLGKDYHPDAELRDKAVNAPTAGENYRERVQKLFAPQADASPVPLTTDLVRIAETEMHRVYCSGAQQAASALGATRKMWLTQEDDKVRDTHYYLDRVYVGADEPFYTFDGDKGMYPGDFEKAENNVNCRCFVVYS